MANASRTGDYGVRVKPVRSDEEKREIEAKANEVAGQGKAVNELIVVPDQK